MGRPKPAVELGGRPLISYPIAAVEAAGLEPLVIAKLDSSLPRLECRVVHEPAEPRHPLTGIVTALHAAGGRAAIVVACDMPFVEPTMLEALAGINPPLVVAQTSGGLQPFPGRFGQELIERLEDALEDQPPLVEAIAAASPRILVEEELRVFGEPDLLCFGVNDEADLAAAEGVLASRRAAGA